MKLSSTLQLKHSLWWIVALALTQSSSLSPAQFRQAASKQGLVTITVDASKPVNRFDPSHALGAGVDGNEFGETVRRLSEENVRVMLSAGLKPLTYRLRTELAGEAWHWNPKGSWSDAANHQGYWTSNSAPEDPIKLSYGYRLPRRGNTGDQANDDGFSRIDDGDERTFWKSNPYLDEHFTAEKNSLHPQWVMIDLGGAKSVNAIRIGWGRPFARQFSVQYGDFVGPEDLSQRLPTDWHEFPRGHVTNGHGGKQSMILSAQPLSVRYLRLRLDVSSESGPHSSRDVRDRLGFAIREVYCGTVDTSGRFQDAVRHGPARDRQTTIYVSSTDPWHREIDRDQDTEQPGLDFVFRSGLTNALPVMAPVPIVYDTPANAAAEIRYLTRRGYPIDRVELGEEPDGQFIDAEHYAQLYLQFVETLRQVSPDSKFGGPSMQDIEQTQVPGEIQYGKGGWLGRFLQHLKARGRLEDFSFFSFEWYPFENDCEPIGEQLQNAPVLLTDALKELQEGGLLKNIPWVISEYGYSAFGARAEIDLEGALLNADSVGRFLTLGGDAAYLYGYEPGEVIKENDCSAGNNMMFFLDGNGHAGKPTATYWGARLLSQEWVKPGHEIHDVYLAVSDLTNSEGEQIITAYAVQRPDKLWSVILINKDPKNPHDVKVVFNGRPGGGAAFAGPVSVFQFSAAQYQLNSDRNNPYPIRSEPPVRTAAKAGPPINLPPYSLTIVRGSTAARD